MHRLATSHSKTERGVSLGDFGVQGDRLEIVTTLEVNDSSECGLKFRVGGGEQTIVGYDVRRSELFVDRTKSGEVDFHPAFAGTHKAPLATKGGRIELHIFVDASSIEVFADGGAVVLDGSNLPRQRKCWSCGLRERWQRFIGNAGSLEAEVGVAQVVWPRGPLRALRGL